MAGTGAETERSMTAEPDLQSLRRLVDEALAASNLPAGVARWRIPPGQVTEEVWAAAWDVVRFLKDDHHDVYAMYLYEQSIAGLILDQFFAAIETPTVADVVAELRRVASEEDEWLVEVPLANAVPPAETFPLGDRAMLVIADQDRDWSPWGSHLSDVWAIKKHLGDELSIRTRWLRAPSPDLVDVDTALTAALMLVERGTEALAVDIARARARVAVSMWCLLKRPMRTATRWPLWPSVGGSAPAPYLTFGIAHKLYEPESMSRRAPRRGNWLYQHGPYRLSRSERLLRAPFEAMDEAQKGNSCAIALLAAARWLYLADREPNELERVERLLCVWNAREALCERLGKGQGGTDERWEALVSRLRIRAHLRSRGYTDPEIKQAFGWSRDLRDMTSHTADAILVGSTTRRSAGSSCARVVISPDASSRSRS